MARGYGSRHKRLRKSWAPKVRAGKVNCARCGLLIGPGQPWDLGHDDDDRSLYSGPEHRRCNRATLTHAKQDARGDVDRFGELPDPEPTNTVERWSRHWYGGFNPRCPDCRRLGSACEAAEPVA